MTPSGELRELHRWPVKSMAGESADAVRVDHRGVGGDRSHALFHFQESEWRRLTAREAPRLLAWSATYPYAPGEAVDPAAPPDPLLRAPDGTAFEWSDPQLLVALATDLEREVRLRSDPAGRQDLPCSVLVTTQATLDAVGRELGVELDLRRFRTNLHLVLDAPAFAEHGWEGRILRVGTSQLELLHPCGRCVIPTRHPDTQEKWPQLLRHLAREHRNLFGINARPLGPATIKRGDQVTIG